MNFAMNAGDLASVLAAVKGVIPARATIPILTHVLIEARAGKVSVRGTCLDMEMAASAPADVKVDGETTVHAEILHGLARRLPRATVATFKVEDDVAIFTAGRATYRLRTLPVQDFPARKEVGGETFSVSAAALKELLESTVTATANSTVRCVRWYHKGVHLHIVDRNGLKLSAVASDDHRISYREMEAPAGVVDHFGVTLPAVAVQEMISLLSTFEGDVEIAVSDTRAVLSGPDAELSTSILEGTFPNYERFIPKPNGAQVTVRPGALIEAVDRAVVVLAGDQKRVPAVGLVPGVSGLGIVAGSNGAEDASELVEAEVHERCDEIGVSASYLVQMLKHWPDVPVDIQQSVPGGPILFSSSELPAYRQIIMPMRR